MLDLTLPLFPWLQFLLTLFQLLIADKEIIYLLFDALALTVEFVSGSAFTVCGSTMPGSHEPKRSSELTAVRYLLEYEHPDRKSVV